MTDADQIATELAAWLTTITTSVKLTAENPPLVPIIDRIVEGGSILAYPFEEDEEVIDRADSVEAVRTVCVVVQHPIDAKFTRAKGIAWLNEIKAEFPGLYFTFPDGAWRWRKNRTKTLYDFDALETRFQFLSVFHAEFYNFV